MPGKQENSKLSKEDVRARLLRCRQVASARKENILFLKARELNDELIRNWDSISEKNKWEKVSGIEMELGIDFVPESLDDKRKQTLHTNLKAGVGKVDITPPLGVEAVGHARIMTGLRDPLKAGVIYFENNSEKAIIITLDLCGISYSEVDAIRNAVSETTRVPIDNILVAATHNHSGPMLSIDDDYCNKTIQKIAAAAAKAKNKLRDVSLSYGEDSIDFVMNRRLERKDGKVGGPDPNGTADKRVRVIQMNKIDTEIPLALLISAACHATFFIYRSPFISADYPGEANKYLETIFQNKTQSFFLQGCCGDTRPMLMDEDGQIYNAKDGDIRWGGLNLAGAVLKAISPLNREAAVNESESSYTISAVRECVLLPAKVYKPPFFEEHSIYEDINGAPYVRCELQAIRVGKFLFVAIPGEAFSEYAEMIESLSPEDTIVFPVNYANGYIGYIPTKKAYQIMGYEPSSSPLKPEAGDILLDSIRKLITSIEL